MKKVIMMAIAFACAAFTSVASASSNEVYTGVGTTGLTVGYARSIAPNFGARAELNILHYNGNLDDSDISYEAKLRMNTAGAYVDYFPFASSGFRVTAGAIVGNKKVDLTAKANSGTVTLNGSEYPARGESLYGSVKLPTVAPYIGIGTGINAGKPGLNVIVDAGVAYGKPDVSLTASPTLLALAGQSNVDAERNRVQDKVDKYNLYPVLRISVGYAF